MIAIGREALALLDGAPARADALVRLITALAHEPGLCAVCIDDLKRALAEDGLGAGLGDPEGRGESQSFEAPRFWEHSLAVAAAAGALAVAHAPGRAGAAYATGLVHDIGRLLFACAAPARFDELERALEAADPVVATDVEERLFGADHAAIGAAALARWGLPQQIAEAVRWHHRPAEAPSPIARSLAELVHGANAVAWGLAVGPTRSLRPPPLDADVERRLQLDARRGAVWSRAPWVTAVDRELERAERAFELPLRSADDARGALHRAYAELGRLHLRYAELKGELERRIAALEALTTVDELTSLYNRRKCVEVLDREVARAARYRRPLSVAFIDLDHLKDINHEIGQEAGDRVLGDVAHLIRGASRTSDLVARYGGEEIVTILPETDLAPASVYAERVRKRVEHYGRENADRLGGRLVTVSIGVAALDGPTDAASLLAAADAALHASKSRGRNRVTLGGASSSGPTVVPPS